MPPEPITPSAAAAEPPAPLRVARRAVALLLVTARGVVERQLDSPHTPANHARLLEWADELAIDDEVEPWEWNVVRGGPGMLDPQAAIDAVWRAEGLAVLAWALYRADLPKYDQPADLERTWEAVGLFHDARVKELCWNPMLRPPEELEAFRRRTRGYHERLHARRGDDDLTLQGTRLDAVPPDVFAACRSIAVERHRAAEWLCRGPAVYSDAAIDV